MALADILERLTLTRRLVRSLERIAVSQEQTNVLLARLADHLAPIQPQPTAEEIKTAGPSFVSDRRHAELEEWLGMFADRVGREPSEEEIQEFLDEREGITR